MASPATAAFLTAWRRSNRDVATLVKVELTDPSALTLYLSTREIATPGPTVWQAALADLEPIHAPGSLRESSWSPCSSGFTVLDVPLAHQAAGKRAVDVFRTHAWVGSTVTIYLWETSLSAFADALQVFKGWVQDYELERFRIAVRCIQRWDWNREVDLVQVTRKKYPRAAEASVGRFIPKVRGSARAVGLRIPWLNEYGTDQHAHEHVAGGRRSVRGVVVDVGGGGLDPGGSTKVIFTSHQCKTFNDSAKGCVPYIEMADRLCLFDAAGADIFNDSTDGAGVKVGDVPSGGTDPYNIAFYPLRPVNVELVAANNAQNPRAVLDVENETSYAVLDYDLLYREVKVRLPTVSPAGVIDSVYYTFAYRVLAGTLANIQFEANNGAGTVFPSPQFPVSSDWTVQSVLDAAPLISTEWNFGGIVMRVFYTGADSTAIVHVAFMGAIVKFRPSREVLNQVYGVTGYQVFHPTRGGVNKLIYGKYKGAELAPIYGLTPYYGGALHPWFATLEGYADSGGTYTGSGTDLIQRPCDVAQHILVEDGKETTGDIERGTSVFGSFVDARALLKTWRQSDMVSVHVMSGLERVATALERLCEDFGMWIYLSEFDDKWKCVVWKADAAVDYSPKLTAREIAAQGLRLRPTPGTRRESGITVRYGYDDWQGKTVHECSVGPGRSNSGHKYRNLRDQHFTIIDSGSERNDKIDFTSSAGTFAATISAGAKTPATMMADVKTALTAQWNPATGAWVTCHGTTIVTGINDRWTVQENEGAQDIVIAVCLPGTYATMEALATAWQTALNNVSDSFTVTYSRTTQFFTVARAGNTFRIYVGGGVYADYTGNFTLGMTFATTAYAASQISLYQVEEERFIIGNTYGAFDLKWETGTNGTNGNNINAANVLGYDAARDGLDYSLTFPTRRLAAVCPTNTREQSIAAQAALTGERLPRVIDNQTIWDHDTAREVRDRATDLLCVNRPEVQIPLLWNPDLERGRVLEFDSSPDDLWPYAVEGSDGSWAGKKFQVIDKVQHLAGSYMTEVTAVEIS